MNAAILFLFGCTNIVLANPAPKARIIETLSLTMPIEFGNVSISPRSKAWKHTYLKDSGSTSQFMKNIRDFDKAVSDIKRNLKPKNQNFIALMYTIGLLSMFVAKDGWESYEDSYWMMVFNVDYNLKANLQQTMDVVNCYLDTADRQIERMRILKTNVWIQGVCETETPAKCDEEVEAMVKFSNDADLTLQFNTLQAVGRAAAIYLQRGADFHRRWAKEDFRHLMELLRPLVAANSLAYQLVFRRRDDKCYPVDVV